ncbi:MAG: hypothetical protein ACWGQW_03245 [bacterium]
MRKPDPQELAKWERWAKNHGWRCLGRAVAYIRKLEGNMKLAFSLNELKIMHDTVCTHEEMAGDDPESFGDQGEYTTLRKKLKDAIDHIEKEAVIQAEVADG